MVLNRGSKLVTSFPSHPPPTNNHQSTHSTQVHPNKLNKHERFTTASALKMSFAIPVGNNMVVTTPYVGGPYYRVPVVKLPVYGITWAPVAPPQLNVVHVIPPPSLYYVPVCPPVIHQVVHQVMPQVQVQVQVQAQPQSTVWYPAVRVILRLTPSSNGRLLANSTSIQQCLI